jgi:sirohydrochlorin cobaltochelatase
MKRGVPPWRGWTFNEADKKGSHMQKRQWLAVAMAVMLIGGAAISWAGHGEKAPEKKAILLVAFGTSVPEAQKAFAVVEDRARKAFAGVEIRWAYTSRIIRNKLAKEGQRLDSPETALAKLMEDGFTHVALLSLHTIPGEEFHELHRNAHLFGQMAGGFEKILLARPLLSSAKDMETVAKALLKRVPNRKTGEAVLFMGHGTAHHPADALYLAMNQVFQDLDPIAFVGTVEGTPSLEDLLPKLKTRKVKKVHLVPLMSVAGDHARNDMAGDEPDSWKSILMQNGFACETILTGTAEYPEIVDLWLEHLRIAMAHL